MSDEENKPWAVTSLFLGPGFEQCYVFYYFLPLPLDIGSIYVPLLVSGMLCYLFLLLF